MRWSLFALLAAVASSSAGAAEPSPVPEWMRPGARVTYFEGASSLQTAGQILVQDDQGGWVNAAGQKFSVQDNPSVGGAGYTQITILAADAKVVAAEMRMFLLTDPQGGRVTASTASALVGTPAALGAYWASPASLAARPDSKQGGVTVRRMPYPVRGRVHEAIVIEVRSGTGYQRSTFDLATGLLLAASSSSVGAAGFAPGPNGTSMPVAGATMITSTLLTDLRQLRLPWIDDARPESLAGGARLDFRGTYTTAVPGVPMVSQGIATSLTFGEPGARWVSARFTAALTPILGGPPQVSTTDRAFGAASNLPLWIQPATIARLVPGTVLDEDPVTHFRTTYLGVAKDHAAVVEEGPFDFTRVEIDAHTGVLDAASTRQQIGPAQTQVRVTRFNGR